jgi:hypothetical protein
MVVLSWLILLSGAYPLLLAWNANRRTALLQAVYWAAVAWAVWGVTLLRLAAAPLEDAAPLRYLALCLTGCAFVAVLGARRPGVGAWNFVVAGLLAVLLLPVASGLGRPSLHWANALFLAGTLAAGVLNYLPTRLLPAALTLGLGCGLELPRWFPAETGGVAWADQMALPVGLLLVALTPWVALVAVVSAPLPAAEFDRLWVGFRDRFGLLWALRVREQFNRAAANAGWPVVLRWRGLRLLPGTKLPDLANQKEIVDTLVALLKRFGPEEGPEETAGGAAPAT